MGEYKCGNCREILILSPRARFCPECGSSSLNLLIKELLEPAQRETLGVYSPTEPSPAEEVLGTRTDLVEEEDKPRKPRRR